MILFIVIIFLESLVIKWFLKLPFFKSLLYSFLMNIVSTLIGLMVSMISHRGAIEGVFNYGGTPISLLRSNCFYPIC